MKITCKKCGNTVHIHAGGRKSYSIPFAIVCKGLREGLNRDGGVNFSAAARIIEKETGIRVSSVFVWQRFYRSGKKLEDILARKYLEKEAISSGEEEAKRE